MLVALLSIFFAGTGVLGTIGWSAYQSGTFALDESLAKALVAGLPFALFCAIACFFALLTVFSRLKYRSELRIENPDSASTDENERKHAAARKGIAFFTGSWSVRCVARTALLVLVCWIPYLVLYAPGVLTFDPLWSIMQCFGSGALPMITPLDGGGAFSAHKPLVHTWILGGFLLAGNAFGSQTIGLFLYVLLQCVCMAASLAAACCYLAKLGVSWRVRCGALVFCAAFPFIPLYAVNCFNDVMFSWIYLLFLIATIEVVRTRSTVLHRVGFTATYAFLGVALACTKNPGIYLVLITVAIEALVYRRNLIRFAIPFFTPLLISAFVLPMFVYPAADVVSGSSSEALGPLYQSTAAYANRYPQEITDDERSAINAVLEYDALSSTYDPVTQDPVKTLQRTEATGEDKLRYFAAWVHMGMKHPEIYLVSIGLVPMPFCCPSAEFTYYDNSAPTTIDYYLEGFDSPSPQLAQAMAHLDVNENPAFDEARTTLRTALSTVGSIPVLGWPLGLGFWASWVPLFCVVGICVSRRRWTPTLVPTFLSVALLALSPWAMARYALPLVLSAPLLIGVLYARIEPYPPSATN
ncbi:DUF6020 family protein [Gordonibacter massiliensis (ex Traore et al. 2017)]|uniref:DUF6020 family protein n=1 Tax=Gordonibacter massiliensis (ex Traore et al. 2017) TaxID=1841863 RepID=UPI001C8C8EEE|nr:DUF6020 family protein [Gordonibacter massiliensis (ex Traore et al. 2017)]MBX9032546.1 hypothetical protein [Gordonibacter massiliensis (ex Traore et al. 2017)]